MGARNLRELGILLPASTVDVDGLLESIERTPVTKDALDRLRIERARSKRGSTPGRRDAKVETFEHWYQSPSGRAWKLATWSDYTSVPAIVRSAMREEHGSTDFLWSQSAAKGHLSIKQ